MISSMRDSFEMFNYLYFVYSIRFIYPLNVIYRQGSIWFPRISHRWLLSSLAYLNIRPNRQEMPTWIRQSRQLFVDEEMKMIKTQVIQVSVDYFHIFLFWFTMNT